MCELLSMRLTLYVTLKRGFVSWPMQGLRGLSTAWDNWYFIVGHKSIRLVKITS